MNTKRMFKTPEKRKLCIYDNGKLIDMAIPYNGWFGHEIFHEDKSIYDETRKEIMKNLWWLCGMDSNYEGWKYLCDNWNCGQHVFGVPVNQLPDSMFNEGEYEIALASYEDDGMNVKNAYKWMRNHVLEDMYLENGDYVLYDPDEYVFEYHHDDAVENVEVRNFVDTFSGDKFFKERRNG